MKIHFWLYKKHRLFVNFCCLPPRGGSGLKFKPTLSSDEFSGSPSTRREWIEIHTTLAVITIELVSLHAEGVD